MRSLSARAGAVLVGASLVLGGCSLSMPSDPDGTLDEVSGGVLRVGVTPNDDRVVMRADSEPSGADIELVEEFAETIDAEVEWVPGAEEQLVRELEAGELHLIVGGITDETPWFDKAAVTRPYLEVAEDDGTTHRLVMLTPMGENAFLVELETFLTQFEGKDE